MNNKYEAAEVIVIGTASDTILGEKEFPIPDGVMGETRQEEPQMFDE
jgi:hypothetical protein